MIENRGLSAPLGDSMYPFRCGNARIRGFGLQMNATRPDVGRADFAITGTSLRPFSGMLYARRPRVFFQRIDINVVGVRGIAELSEFWSNHNEPHPEAHQHAH
jgi:hypothetical protein